MQKLVLLRHGQSTWNKENRFTGWVDVDLTKQGQDEARDAGRLMRADGLKFDIAYTSLLKRALRTLWIALDEMELPSLPIEQTWRLNERHYGALQGLKKNEVAAEHGESKVKTWRRSYKIPPPPLSPDDPRHPSHDPLYAKFPNESLPSTESLQDTVTRFLPYWEDTIAPSIQEKKQVLIVAHGNSLRALVKLLEDMSEQEIVELNIPTGVPLIYELDQNLKPQHNYCLGNPEVIKKATADVARQGSSIK